jgi:CheY-like chemotaxis protein
MTERHILVVDDEIVNLEIIQEYLDAPDYRLVLATSADQAWERMDSIGERYDLAILDRMMPGMSGIELLRKMKADARYRDTPVIMQTAATSPDQVREGIASGAYYYLAKPYEPETLATIVRAALNDIARREEATRNASAHVRAMELLERAEFRYRRLDEIGPLIEVLASLCPVPAQAAAGLTELLVNAVEHGNLDISYAEKKRLRQDCIWEAEVERRQNLPQYRDRWVRINVLRQDDRIEFTVTDEGAGFDWQRYLEFDPLRAADPNGRGIAMARILSFTSLQYTGCGNQVSAIVFTRSD